jgi:hypothetical protein
MINSSDQQLFRIYYKAGHLRLEGAPKDSIALSIHVQQAVKLHCMLLGPLQDQRTTPKHKGNERKKALYTQQRQGCLQRHVLSA